MAPYVELSHFRTTTIRYIARRRRPPYREDGQSSYHDDDSDDDVSDSADGSDPSYMDGYAVEAFLDAGFLSTRLGTVTIEDADEDEDEDGDDHEELDGAGDDEHLPGHDPPTPPPPSTPKMKPLDGWRPLRDAVLLSMHALDAPPTRLVCPGLLPVDDGPPVKCTTPPTFRCKDCFDLPKCGHCFLEAHVSAPFHAIEVCFEH